MLPLKKIFIDSRRSTKDSKTSSDLKTDFPVNITLPPNTTFYIADVTIPVTWYTVEAGRHATIYVITNGSALRRI